MTDLNMMPAMTPCDERKTDKTATAIPHTAHTASTAHADFNQAITPQPTWLWLHPRTMDGMRIASLLMTLTILVSGVPVSTAYAADEATPSDVYIIECPPLLQWLCGKQ